jgi:MFS family permease
VTNIDVAKLQKRVVRALMTGQMLSGFGVGSTFSVGAILAGQLSGSAAWSGSASTFSTLGAAVWAIPLSRLAVAKGRRVALASGAVLAIAGAAGIITAAGIHSFALLLVGLFFIGAASAISLQARFTAADLPRQGSPARDLALVVWATTIGAVIGPNLIGPGDALGQTIGLAPYAGPFMITIAAQLSGALAFWFGLKPDPLLVARSLDSSKTGKRHKVSFRSAVETLRSNHQARFAVFTLGLSHMVMVAVMSMTPVHMAGLGFSLVIIGFTVSLHVAGMWAFSPIFGWLADRFGNVRMIVMAQAIYVIALMFCSFGDTSRFSISMGLLLLGLGWSASTVSASALLAKSLSGPEKANVQGLSDSFMSLSGAFGGAVSGALLATVLYGGLSLVALAPVTAILALALRRIVVKRKLAPGN